MGKETNDPNKQMCELVGVVVIILSVAAAALYFALSTN